MDVRRHLVCILTLATLLPAAAAGRTGAPSFVARAYFMDARRSYRTAAFAGGTNSVVGRYVGEAGAAGGVEAGRRRIPDEPIFVEMPDGRCARDIGGWTGLATGIVFRVASEDWRKWYLVETVCGVDEVSRDIDYELSSFGGRRCSRTDRDYVAFKQSVAAGQNLLSPEEVSDWKRRLVPKTEWLYSLVDQRAEVIGKPGTWIDLAKGWNEVPRGTRVSVPKTVTSLTPPPFPNEPRRPVEFTRINRTKDDHPPLLTLARAEGWTVECRDAEATFRTTDVRELFGGPVTRLDYRMTGPGTNTLVRIRPPAPVRIGRGFDSTGLWLYGNRYKYDVADGASPFAVRALFRTTLGEVVSLPVAENWCAYWFLNRYRLSPSDADKMKDGGTFEGFEIGKFANTNSVLSLFFSNFSVFDDERGMPDIPKRPKRPVKLFADQDQGMNTGAGTLSFPTTPDTVVPPVAAVDRDLEFRFPARPDESWDDLAFRYRGGDWVRVAIGGGVKPRSAGKGGTYRFHRIGNSIVCDLQVKGGKVERVDFGHFDYAKLPAVRKVPVPFYLARVFRDLDPKLTNDWCLAKRPGLLVTEAGGRPLFIGATWDWTQTAATWPVCYDARAPFGDLGYYERTDGTRADCCERLVWSFARQPIEALANIPNPKSPFRREAGTRAFAFARSYDLPLTPDVNPQENETRERLWDYWRRVRRLGIRDLNMNGHEKMWRDYMDSFTFTTNAAPLRGGDAALLTHVKRLKSLGYHVGPYNNFTDFATVNENWDATKVLRENWQYAWRTNQLTRAWTRTYLAKPVYAVHAMETLLPVVKKKFDFEGAYSDVHTAYAPWWRVDCDARMPGAASMASTFYAYGELLDRQRYVWGGPVFSEGLGHVLYAGLSDGDFARDDDYFGGLCSPEAQDPATAWDWPWIVDYDLLRIHPLNCCLGTTFRNFYGRRRPADPDEAADRYFAYFSAFGHAPIYFNGFFMRDNSLAIDDILEVRLYYMMLAVARCTTQADVKEIRYANANGEWLDSAEALFTDAVRLNRIRVTYEDGTVVAVNGGRQGDLVLDWFGERLSLAPNCTAVRKGDEIRVFCGFANGHRADLAVTPDYVYIDGRGRRVDFAEGSSDGQLIRLRYTALVGKPLSDREEDVLLRRGATFAELPYAASSVTASDIAGEALGAVPFSVHGGRTLLTPVDGAISYRILRKTTNERKTEQ